MLKKLFNDSPVSGNSKTAAQRSGEQAERLAQNFLEQNGLKFILNNYRCKLGEIDLVMRDKAELVFIEVRYRKNNYYGDAIETINYRKQKKWLRAIHHYCNYYKVTRPWRCDVIGITGKCCEENLEWLQDVALASNW